MAEINAPSFPVRENYFVLFDCLTALNFTKFTFLQNMRFHKAQGVSIRRFEIRMQVAEYQIEFLKIKECHS